MLKYSWPFGILQFQFIFAFKHSKWHGVNHRWLKTLKDIFPLMPLLHKECTVYQPNPFNYVSCSINKGELCVIHISGSRKRGNVILYVHLLWTSQSLKQINTNPWRIQGFLCVFRQKVKKRTRTHRTHHTCFSF